MATKKTAASKMAQVLRQNPKRVYFKQSDFPLTTLQDAQCIAAALSMILGATKALLRYRWLLELVRQAVFGPLSLLEVLLPMASLRVALMPV